MTTPMDRDLIHWFVTAELRNLRDVAEWNRPQLGRAIGKHANTILAWERGERLPDKGNIALVCEALGADPARTAFLKHVVEQLRAKKGVVSDLEKRNLYLVEAAERTYGEIIKFDPLLVHGVGQTEAYHMKRLGVPLQGPAVKIKNWLRKARRISTLFGRTDAPITKILVPANAIRDLENLEPEEKAEQIQRLQDLDARPNCEVRVVVASHEALHAFDFFRAGGLPEAGPDFVFVETIDQSRHIVEAEKLALYDQILSALWEGAIPIGRYLDGRVHQLAEELSE